MIMRMKPRLYAALCGLCTLFSPVMALAAEEINPDVDTRLSAYGKHVSMDSGTALTYMLFIVLALISLGVLFKDAKRSHLD